MEIIQPLTIDFENDDETEQIQTTVFKFAKAGNAEGLKSLLETLTPDKLKRVLYGSEPRINGANPLIIAARRGHVNVVEVLLNKGIDPHHTGTVTFDGEIITRVPPLWAAAAAGYLDICKVLVSRGVNVNQTTNTNSTPLRGACYDGHLEIVKFLVENGADIEIANRHGHTALMIASYREKVEVVRYLLSIGARIDRTSIKGNTVLHDAAEAGNYEILKILIDAGAKMQADDYGVTPLLSSALSGHLELMPLLLTSDSNKEKHDAWKLLGATLVDKRQVDLGSAIVCWRNAFDEDIIDENFSMEFIGELGEMQKRIYSGFQEAKSLREVESLVGDPDAIRMQALIIRERILGDSHPDTHHYLRLRGAYYLDIGSWDRTWELWSYILQLEQFHHHPMSLATGSTFCAFFDALTIMIEELMRADRRQINKNLTPSIEQVAIILERAIYEAERYLYSDEDSRNEHLWAFDDRSIKQELENLLGLCLQFVHLISRVNLVNVVQPDNQSKPDTSSRTASALVPARANNLGRSDGPSPLFSSYRNGTTNTQTANCYASPAPSPPSGNRSPAWKRQVVAEKPNYIITNSAERMCSRAYLTAELEPFPKLEEEEGLAPHCPHLKCLVHRMLSVFQKLDVKVLHMACEERDMREDLEFAPRISSLFVIEKLLCAGVNPSEVDENGNTPLHVVLLTNQMEKHAIFRLLLDVGAPLFARNHSNQTCFDLLRKKPNVMKTLRIGRYLSLKQIAANVVKRNKLDCCIILPGDLREWIAIF